MQYRLKFVLNLQLIGIGVIVVSSLALHNDISNGDIDTDSRPIFIFFIVIGSIVFLISFFGCCGAIKESICLTWLVSIEWFLCDTLSYLNFTLVPPVFNHFGHHTDPDLCADLCLSEKHPFVIISRETTERLLATPEEWHQRHGQGADSGKCKF